jgi:hypothetical protein
MLIGYCDVNFVCQRHYANKRQVNTTSVEAFKGLLREVATDNRINVDQLFRKSYHICPFICC